MLLNTGSVSNAAGGIISSYFFGIAASGAVSVDNSGTITASSTTIGIGAFLLDGGSLDNAASGTIDGQLDAVLIDGTTTAATVINQGSITATHRAGVDLFGAASYGSNAASGTITGYLGMLLRATGQVVNGGSIGGTRYGVDLVSIGTVINDAAARISATAGVLELAGGTVDNLGIIVGTGTSAKGVYQYAGGYLSNASTGTIDSEGSGVLFTKDAGTVMNLGNIASTDVGGGAGVWLRDGGTVTNASGADISAKFIGVQVGYVTTSVGGTVENAGSIVAVDGTVGAGVWLHGPGAISNASSGTIYGGLDGVVIYDQTTLINAGSIGGQQYAVHAAAGFADRLIVAPGAIFSGLVSGGNALTATIASVLELAAGSAAGTIAGFDSKYLGFREIAIDAGAAWSLGGTAAASQTVSFGGPDTTLTLANPGSMAGEIIGFSAHDTIVLAGVTGVSAATLNVANQLTVAGPDLTFQFDPKQTFAGTDFGFVQVGDHTDLTVPCFAEGTHIGTPSGEAAVEQLRVGDRVLTRRGERLAVAWLGHRRTDCRRHPRPWEVWPVRVRASAFGAGMPHRDLLLSPDHAICIDNVLIPIRYLINDATILQERVDSVTYWHVELDRHEVLLAEGMPCESYLDTGNRGAQGCSTLAYDLN